MVERNQRLGLFDQKDIIPMGVRTGSDDQPLQLEGNSILSLVFVYAIDAGTTLSVDYYDSGSGTSLGEFNLVASHPILSTPGSNRILVTRLTNKTTVRWTVTGPGTAYFGVYAYVVSSFASDLDQALKVQGTIVDLVNDKGLVAMGYDSVQGKFFFLPIENGALKTTGAELPGDPRTLISDDDLVTTPTISQDLIDSAVPAGETWRLRQVTVNCRAYGKFDILLDTVRIGSGRTGPATPNVVVTFNPYEIANTTQVIKVQFLETVGPVVDVEAYVRATNN